MRKTIITLFALASMFAGVTPGIRAEQIYRSVPVWEARQGGNGQYYRIPAVAAFPSGTLVALCDNGDVSGTIKIKRSYDGGTTWSKEVRLAPGFTLAHGDASLVYDTQRGRMVCLFNANKGFGTDGDTGGQIWMTTSIDGVSWSEPVEKTSQFAGQAGWENGFTASGNMLRTSSGDLMVVANGRMKGLVFTNQHERTYEYVFKSSNGGDDWTLVSGAGKNGENGPVEGFGNEAKLVELSDGSLLCSVRSNTYSTLSRNKKKHRFSRSDDGGATWRQLSEGAIAECAASSGSNGDIIAVDYNGRRYLLLAVASNTSDTKYRRDIMIYYSIDDGATWQSGRMLFKGYAGYASLVKLDDEGTVGALVEVGQSGYYFSQYFFTFNMEWLLGTGDLSYDGTLDCDGDRYMKIPYDEAFGVPSDGAITITANLLLRSYGRPQGIVASRESNSSRKLVGYELHGGWGLDQCFSNNVNFDGSRSALDHKYADTSNSLIAGRWAHVAWTYDAATGESRLYVDGVCKSISTQDNNKTSAKGHGITLPGLDILVGTRYENKNPQADYILDGKIDDLRFYRSALSEADIVRDKESGFPLEDKPLIAAYDFQGIVGNQVTDISGNGHTGELVGTFPEAPKDYLTYKVEPECGSLKLTRFDDGIAQEVGTDGFYNSKNADYRAVFTMSEEEARTYEFLGIQVNGHAIDADGFFKAGADSEVTVLLKSTPLRFKLVQDDGTGEYELTPDNDNGYVHTRQIEGDFSGRFHIEEIPSEARVAASPLMLYGHPEEETLAGHGFVNVRKGIDYKVYNIPEQSEETRLWFTTHGYNVSTGDYEPAITGTFHNPVFTLTYSPEAKVLSVDYADEGGITGIGTVTVEGSAAKAHVEYFNLQGVRVPADRLAPGIYIRRQGTSSEKIVVR